MANLSSQKSREDLDKDLDVTEEELIKRRDPKSLHGESFSDDEEEKKKVKKRPSIFKSRSKTKKEKDDKKDRDGKGDEKSKKYKYKDGDDSKHRSEEEKTKGGKSRDRKEMKKRSNTISELSVSKIKREVRPIFGVPLIEAVEETKLHDGVELPCIVRECIDYVEEYALTIPGIYRLSGIKSKVEMLKAKYNEGEPVELKEYDPTIITSLLKLYLREMPESVLTSAMHSQFEDTAGIPNETLRLEEFQKLLMELPTCHYTLLSWLIVHFAHVLQHEAENKMTIQNISIVMCPTMRVSHRILNLLFTNWEMLFGHVQIKKCRKPLHLRDEALPSSPRALEEELHNHEALLNKMHHDLNKGTARDGTEEELWEVQRVVTQLKRKLRKAKAEAKEKEKKSADVSSKNEDELSNSREDTGSVDSREDMINEKTEVSKDVSSTKPALASTEIAGAADKSIPDDKKPPKGITPPDPAPVEEKSKDCPVDLKNVEVEIVEKTEEEKKGEEGEMRRNEGDKAQVPLQVEEEEEDEDDEAVLVGLLLLHAELMAKQQELQKIHSQLQQRIEVEKGEVERLKTEVDLVKRTPRRLTSGGSADDLSDTSSEDERDFQNILQRLLDDNQKLWMENKQLNVKIVAERESCTNIKAKIKAECQRERITQDVREEKKRLKEEQDKTQGRPPENSAGPPAHETDRITVQLNQNSSNNIYNETEI